MQKAINYLNIQSDINILKHGSQMLLIYLQHSQQ